MTRTRLIKHNPRFLSDEELLSKFVSAFLNLTFFLGITKDNTGPVNQHVIIISPHGMGKTMLVRRFALAVRKDPVLGSTWYTLSLPEDVYVISGEGELWLQTLRAKIANQEKEAGGEFERWMNRYDALFHRTRTIKDFGLNASRRSANLRPNARKDCCSA